VARIALDIDSTLHPYWDLLQRIARERYGVDLPYEDQHDWGITAQGHWIHVTSHRRTSTRAATERWLDRIGMPYDDLHCSFDKVTRCSELGIHVLVDDSPVNIVRARDAGIVPATIVHPWNVELVERDGVIGAPDWPRLRAKLAPVLERIG
jgi:uncharacterized protein